MKVILDSSAPVTDKVFEVMVKAKEHAGLDEEIELVENYKGASKRMPVLALGSVPRRSGLRTVEAPSGAALVTRADSITRLSRAFNLIVCPPYFPELQYSIIWSTDKDIDVLQNLVHSGKGAPVVIDIETSGNVDEDRVQDSKLISVAFTFGGRACVISEDALYGGSRARVRHALLELLRSSRIIAHNGKFDLKYLLNYTGLTVRQVNWAFDTMLAHYCLFPASTGQHGLKVLADAMFGSGDWDSNAKAYLVGKTYPEYEIEYDEDGHIYTWHDARKYKGGKNGSGYERIPRPMLYEYNAYDVYWTWHLYVHLSKELELDSITRKVFDKRMLLSDMFIEVETPGWNFDIARAHELKAELEYEAIQLRSDLDEIAGRPINPNSPMQVKQWFRDLGYPLPKEKSKDKNGRERLAESSNEKAMNKVLESEDYPQEAKDFAAKLLECRGNTKNLGTYVNGFLESVIGGRVHSTFNISAASTGRLSTPKPAIMTIPRDKKYRGLVLPDEGHVLVKPDYSQIEWRVMAVLSGDPYLMSLFQEGSQDAFDAVMPVFFPGVDMSTKTPAERKEYRTKAKTVIYGLSFNRKAAAIGVELGIPWYEAQNIIDNYMDAAPLYALWREDVMRRAVEGEPIESIYGFHFQQEVVTSGNKVPVENQAVAFLPQSTANDTCLEAALRINAWLPEYPGARIIATVHDQIIVSCPIEYATEVGNRMEYEMSSAAERNLGTEVVFDAEPEYGFSWAEEMNPQQWEEWKKENGYAST